jgi:hypothetical protein
MKLLIRHQNSLPVLISLRLSERCLLQAISAFFHMNDGTDICNEFLKLYNAHVADLLHHNVAHRQLRYPSLVLMA